MIFMHSTTTECEAWKRGKNKNQKNKSLSKAKYLRGSKSLSSNADDKRHEKRAYMQQMESNMQRLCIY